MARTENKEAASTATQLAAEIARILREHAGMTQVEVGQIIGYTGSAVSAMETGAQPASDDMLLGLNDLLTKDTDILKAAIKYVRLDKFPRQFKDFALIEAKALTLCSYETLVVDGLFQTEDYARALIGGGYPPPPEQRVAELVEARMARKALFDREPTALIELILEESVLMRLFGTREIMRAQLLSLAQYAQRPNVTIQVLPLNRGLRGDHAGAHGPMKLLETLEHDHLVYLEAQDVSSLISDPAEVSIRAHRYAKIRAQALGPDESLGLIERLAGEL
ncbi:helix-turn-helix transcriptional regulator [Streptomyces sp. MST-110588]|uniref:helix-turn-helix domain-containing protein n=1 Tax=Streptomyces sp. MST-110588 TaxID=2833628 RepID=UPI001F5C9624|nr:helix-turn-helix transcriptional regulator [Streptomyces sp. MST-110588]UNO43871.1 helix-turn-helix domain-containing protein [Streptomyces sp. MST-110588]